MRGASDIALPLRNDVADTGATDSIAYDADEAATICTASDADYPDVTDTISLMHLVIGIIVYSA